MKLSLSTIILALAGQGLVTPAYAVCNKYVLIVSRPTGQQQGSLAGFDGMINTTLKTVSGGIVYSTQYDASQGSKAETVQGGQDVIKYINQGLTACPSQKYALLGYSLGASVSAIAMNNFNKTVSAGYKAIVAAVLEGNPAHETGESANIDQNGGTSTKNCRGFQYSGSDAREHISAAWYASGKLRDICFKGDTVCCCPAFSFCGGSWEHLYYGFNQTVQDIGAKFLIQQLQ